MAQGGKRAGAGRKPRFGLDKTIAMRVPVPLKPLLDQWLADYRALRIIQNNQAKDLRLLRNHLSALSLPFFANRISAGAPMPADDEREADVDLNTLLVRHPETTFLITVNGDSMRDAAILDGDILLVDSAVEPRHGKIVVAVLNGELTVKRLEKTKTGIRLLPENPDFSPLAVPEEADFFIWGVVTRVIHNLI